ncbi:hypothetical protein L1887_10341 [Cichorium endivia]|nr:hypothetical protein L1887_10341 [Cichorium endivia]
MMCLESGGGDQFWTDLPVVNARFIENLRSSSWNHLTGLIPFLATIVIANCRLTSSISRWLNSSTVNQFIMIYSGKASGDITCRASACLFASAVVAVVAYDGGERREENFAPKELLQICANPGLPRSEVEEDEAEKEQTKIMNKNPNLDEFEEKPGEARQSIPEDGCGRVMHLVKAFETALTLPKSKTRTDDEEQNEEIEDDTRKVPKWELPGLRPRAPVTEFSSPDLFLTPESLGLDSRSSSSSSGRYDSERLAEEEELRRLRKELVPKAQPMPYFDRPFIPKRSEKQPTMPKDPKFRNPQHKKMNGGH